jgi:hypothetical protein
MGVIMKDRAKRRLRIALDIIADIVTFGLRQRNKPRATVAADAIEGLRNGLPERDDPTVRDKR